MRELRYPNRNGAKPDDTSLLDDVLEAEPKALDKQCGAQQWLDGDEIVLRVSDKADVSKIAAAIADYQPQRGRKKVALRELRRRRDELLAASDWTQLADVPVATRDAWQQYRQALRDLPANTSDPDNPIWPEQPA